MHADLLSERGNLQGSRHVGHDSRGKDKQDSCRGYQAVQQGLVLCQASHERVTLIGGKVKFND